MIKNLLIRYKGVLLYLVFGVLTTLINLASYTLCFSLLHIPNVPSTVIAWFLAVAFAFVTNKLWVFDSKSFDRRTLRHEIPTFLCARISTGVLDVFIMWLAVDVLSLNPTVWKLLSNVLVIILNYVASKLLIFRKAKPENSGDSGR